MRRFLLLFLFAACANAQEIVTLDTRAGVKQPFFTANTGGRKAEAVALRFIGGGVDAIAKPYRKDID